jgi:hypothetical protein
MYEYIHTKTHKCKGICLYACIHTGIHTHKHIYMYANILMCIQTCMHINIHVNMYMCAYKHKYMKTCMYACIHTNMYTYYQWWYVSQIALLKPIEPNALFSLYNKYTRLLTGAEVPHLERQIFFTDIIIRTTLEWSNHNHSLNPKI